MNHYRAVAYVEQALSFLFLNERTAEKIRAVYLYGSAVRNDLSRESDIDVFIDCEEHDEKAVEKAGLSAVSRFYDSKDYEKWKLLKFTHPISVNTGTMKSWELRTSIESEGIILYSKQALTVQGRRETLFSITLPSKREKYLKFTRNFFGRKEKPYKGTGIIDTLQGKKISSNVFTIPKERQKETMIALEKFGVDYSMKEYYILE